ncbi:DUF5655 domain-containing protein [Anatilimnocola floriformis]|uniref:DUF5655 domain-containing protein n=1 Tax=Anatilimnocola floriformis TaxID=2948575 RepID=UPI0020C2EAAC|nr:DUF5655 domain-containing protein [Anatilimnocola floriformis]
MPSAKSANVTTAARKKSSVAVAVKRRRAKKPAKLLANPAIVAAPKPSLYSVHPGIAMVQKWISELKGKTGRDVEEWLKHIRTAGPDDKQDCQEWLKKKFNFGTNTSGWLAERAFGKGEGVAAETPEEYLATAPQYVAEMYAGPRQGLKPLHDRLIELAQSLGDSVRICPCKTIVPLYRHHVFAEIRPASNTRIDLGFALQEEPFTARLVDTGGTAKKNRITHRVSITKLSDIDLQVRRWLKQAYEVDA